MKREDVVQVLRVASLDAVTALVRHGGELRVARMFSCPVKLALAAAVTEHVLGRQPCGELPRAIAPRLDGYRVRAGLGRLVGVPEVLGGGVARMKLRGLAPLAAAFGNPFVVLRAYPGSVLPDVVPALDADARQALLASMVAMIARLHARGVTHGSLGAASFAAAGVEATLVELEPLRVDSSRIAADRSALATIARDTLGLTLDEAAFEQPAAPAVDETVAVADEAPDRTIFVPDDPA